MCVSRSRGVSDPNAMSPMDRAYDETRRLGYVRTVLMTLIAIWCAPVVGAETARPETGVPDAVPAADLDDPPETRIRVTPVLTVGAEVQVTYDYENNVELDESTADGRSRVLPALSMALSYDPYPAVQGFLNLELAREFGSIGSTGSTGTDHDARLDLAQAYLRLTDLVGPGVTLQVGRQRFEDDRQWLYDAELDALRVFSRWGRLTLDSSISREDLVGRNLFPHGQPGTEPVNNYVVYGRYRRDEDTSIAAYTVVRDDRSGTVASPRFFGLHASGEVGERVVYWAELAHARGSDGSNTIRGWGCDVGSTMAFDAWPQASLSVGYAFGTGDRNPNDGVDRTFRQTGLQDNTDELNGISSIKYYGELFDPELRNLRIVTVSTGVRPIRDTSSIEVVYHHYRQDHASDDPVGARITLDPSGTSPELGSEIDVIAAYAGLRDVEWEVVLGYFMPGAAFPSGADRAVFTGVEIQYEF